MIRTIYVCDKCGTEQEMTSISGLSSTPEGWYVVRIPQSGGYLNFCSAQCTVEHLQKDNGKNER